MEPTNAYFIDDIDERELSAICYKHGYITTKYISPFKAFRPFFKNGYFLIREGSSKIDGYVIVGNVDRCAVVGGDFANILTFFGGTLDEFLDSLSTFDERFEKWFRDHFYLPSNDRECETMTLNDYMSKALRTANAFLTDEQKLTNGVMGLAGEAGECVDIVKKHLFQGHELDREKLKDELGDVLWYVAITARALGLTLEEVARHNVDKLARRYPTGEFRAQDSIHREETNADA